MKLNKIYYKSIVVSKINDNIIVFHMHESNIVDDYTLVIGVTTFNEFIGHEKPKYIIFDKKDLAFDSTNNMKGFIKMQGVDQLIEFGVKRIFFIVNEIRLKEIGKAIGYRGITAFSSLDQVLVEIEKEESKI